MADQKQLILVVEATAAMGPYWQTIFTCYLYKIIRCFCSNESVTLTHKTPVPVPVVELALVTYNTHGSNSACLVQRSGWTSHPDVFFMWLSSIPFSGGGFNDAAIAEGLGEALVMLASPNGSQGQQHADIQRHCILIASGNPYPLPTPVYRPQRLKSVQSDNNEAQPHSRLCDAETVAKSFSECSVSLSVICPKQLPKLRAIYNAGKRSLHAADPPIDNVKTPNHLVLISENFMEALAALSWKGMAKLLLNQTRVKIDVSSVPLVSVPPPTSIPSVNGSMANQQPISVGSMALATIKVEPTTVSSMVSAPAFQHIPPVPRAASQEVPALQTPSPLSASQEMISSSEAVQDLKPMVKGMSQGNLPGTHMVHSGMGMSSRNGAMVPTPGLSQQVQPAMQSLGENNNAAATVPLSQQKSSALQSAQSKYTKFWEGNLFGQRQGQPVFITRLEGYMKVSAPGTLASNWPATMLIVRLISQDHISNKHAGKADFLVFRAMTQHGFLGQLQEKKLFAVIQLPSQTLILSVTDKVNRLIGMLFPGDMVVFKQPISGQQLQPQQQPLLQQPPILPQQQQQLPQMVSTGMGQSYVQGPRSGHN